jgi:hypothetical protein
MIYIEVVFDFPRTQPLIERRAAGKFEMFVANHRKENDATNHHRHPQQL